MSFPAYANPVVRGMAGFYTTTFLSAAWSMIIPTIAVLAQYFDVTAGGAAQIVTVFAIGKFIGTIIGGVVIDRMGTQSPLWAAIFNPSVPFLVLRPTLSVFGGASSRSGERDIRPERNSMKGNDPRK